MKSVTKKPLVALCVGLSALFLAATAPLATAESLEEQEKWEKQDHYMQRHEQSVAEQCGAKIPYEWDKKSWNTPGAEEQAKAASGSIYGRCSEAFDRIESICRNSKGGKERVAKTIKKLVCGWGGKGKESFTMKAGVFTYMVDFEASNTPQHMEAWLKKNL